MSSYRGPGIYHHHKGGDYEAIGLAMWEPMADKPDNEPDLAQKLREFAEDFAAVDWDHTKVEVIDEDREMLLRAAELLSEKRFVIYRPLTPGSLLEGMEGVEFWARGENDFNGDGTILDAKGMKMTTRRFIFKSGPR